MKPARIIFAITIIFVLCNACVFCCEHEPTTADFFPSPAGMYPDSSILNNIFYNLPIIMTERLVLRKVSHDDAFDLFAILSHPDVTQYLYFNPYTSIEQVHARIHEMLNLLAQGKPTPWVLELKGTKKVIGYCGFIDMDFRVAVGEMCAVLLPEYWGRGMAKEACLAVVYCGFFAIGLNKVKSCVHEYNQRSIHLHEKGGFVLEGQLRQEAYKDGMFADLFVYSMLRDEFIELYQADIERNPCHIVW